MCADLHQYQSGNIRIGQGDNVMNIRQYIVGTGGAKRDKYDPSLINDQIVEKSIGGTRINCTYNMSKYDIAHSRSENGFLICKENRDNTLHFKFYDVNNNEIIDGTESTTPPTTGGYKKHTNKKHTHKKRSIKKLNKKTYKKLNH